MHHKMTKFSFFLNDSNCKNMPKRTDNIKKFDMIK